MDTHEILSPFEAFDPLDGRPGHRFHAQAENIAAWARRHLAHRSREQIRYLVESINFMFCYREPLRHLFDRMDTAESEEAIDWESLEEASINDEPDTSAPGQQPGQPGVLVSAHPDFWLYSPARLLQRCEPQFAIEGQQELPEVTWSEYYAALALALVGQSQQVPHSDLALLEETPEAAALHREILAERHTAAHLIDAMEAMGRAELLQKQGDIRREAQEEATRQLQMERVNGGIKRHAKTNRIKQHFIRFVTDNWLPSLQPGERFNRSAAAEEFFAEFLEENAPRRDRDLYATYKTNVLRMLKNAFRQFEKTGEMFRSSENDEEP